MAGGEQVEKKRGVGVRGRAGLWLWLMAMIKSWGDQRLPGAAGAEFPGAGGGGRRKGIEVGSARGGRVMLGRC